MSVACERLADLHLEVHELQADSLVSNAFGRHVHDDTYLLAQEFDCAGITQHDGCLGRVFPGELVYQRTAQLRAFFGSEKENEQHDGEEDRVNDCTHHQRFAELERVVLSVLTDHLRMKEDSDDVAGKQRHYHDYRVHEQLGRRKPLQQTRPRLLPAILVDLVVPERCSQVSPESMRTERKQSANADVTFREHDGVQQREQPCEDPICLERNVQRQADQESTTEVTLVHLGTASELANQRFREFWRFRCKQLLRDDDIVAVRIDVKSFVSVAFGEDLVTISLGYVLRVEQLWIALPLFDRGLVILTCDIDHERLHDVRTGTGKLDVLHGRVVEELANVHLGDVVQLPI